MSYFSDTLIHLRKKAGLSQQQLAEATGLSRSAIGMYETGRREPDMDTLRLFASFFGVDMNTLTSPQTAADAERLTAIGAHNVSTVGNIKFDVTPSLEKKHLGAEWRQTLGKRPIWLAASTREGEEELILDAFTRIQHPDLLLLLVPRHPQRFGEVAAMVQERKLALCRRSEGSLPTDKTRVWLGDSMGEMPAYFSVADIALIGGTLLPFGGQNLIEAAACGCPVLVGPHTFNFLQATEDSIACGAAKRVDNADEAASAVEALLEDREALHAMREAALSFSQAHRGATARTMALIRGVMVR